MTTIVFLEDSIQLPTVYDATDHLVNFHVHAVKARFPWELQDRVMAFKPVELDERLVKDSFYPMAEYKAIIKGLDREHSLWSIRDDRALFFLDQLASMVKELRVLWVDLERSRNEYEKRLQERTRKIFNAFKGPKLHLTTENTDRALAFVLGEEEAAEVKAKAKEEEAKPVLSAVLSLTKGTVEGAEAETKKEEAKEEAETEVKKDVQPDKPVG